MPNLEEALNLTRINLQGCIQLTHIDPSVGLLKKLTVLDLKDCKNLVSLPNSISSLSSLEYLSLYGCAKLYISPSLDEPMDADHYSNKLCIDDAAIHLTKDSVICLLPSLHAHSCMRELNLNFCNLVPISDAIGNFHSLEILNLIRNNLVTLPSLKELSKLYHLNLSHCKQLKYLPELPSRTDLSSQIYFPWYPFRYLIDERQIGLYIFNCPQLVEKESCTSKCFSWMKQIVQAQHQCKRLPKGFVNPDITFIIPGSEIPSWFNNQHVDNSIRIDASSLMQHDNNWIGFACCAIFVASLKNETDLAVAPSKTKRAIAILFPVYICNKDVVTCKSDYMFLFYFTRSRFNESYDGWCPTFVDDMKLQFELLEHTGFHLEVKKYGHRWVHEQDLELSNLMHGKDSLARKRKLLAIE